MHVELAADPVELVAEARHGLLPQGGAILSTVTMRFLWGIVIRTTTQTGAKRSRLTTGRRALQYWHQLGRWARPVQGDASLVGKPPAVSRQLSASG
jgi:hypothetical protein